MDARKFQDIADDSRARDFYLSYAAGQENLVIKKAAELRAAKKVVEVSLTAQNKADAEKSCAAKRCMELIYLA